MSYLAPYLDESGLHLPTYADRMEDLIAKYKAIFGEDVYLEPDSMDYQMLSIFAKHLDDLSAVLLDTYNARNPNYATGVSLDTLLPLNGIIRKPATASRCSLTLTGEPNLTVNESGSSEYPIQAMDEAGFIWEIRDPVTFDSEGTARAVAYCTTFGPVTAAIGTINIVNTPINGWYSVTNTLAPILGNSVETDAEVRRRRENVVSKSSAANINALRSSLLSVDGVTRVNILCNDGETTDANGIPAHSFCVVIRGGNADAIANAIWEKKSPGVGTYGTTSRVVRDDFGHENTIRFSREVKKYVTVTITIKKYADYEESLVTEAIPNAVREYIDSLNIGEPLMVSRLYAVVYNAIKTSSFPFTVQSILALVPGGTATSEIINAAYNESFSCIAGAVNIVEVT